MRSLYEHPFLILFGKARFSGLDRLASSGDPRSIEEGQISGAGKSYEHSMKSESYLLESDFGRSRHLRFVHQLLIPRDNLFGTIQLKGTPSRNNNQTPKGAPFGELTFKSKRKTLFKDNRQTPRKRATPFDQCHPLKSPERGGVRREAKGPL
ncbi:hypothetical protein LIER_37675 [Lithospermum erythrorhizon]|uniref:Uncharacterized protein n=1 Tax=Lithospermum erythrorhizon TaxID=34254 RepID=A0AAV3PRW0_LITER